MSVDVNLIKQLRDLTFAPLKDCKECLIEANGDLESAAELLRKKWIVSAGKKADRETKEGMVKALVINGKLIIIKLWCETDFVAKNELFISLVDSIINLIATQPDTNDVATLDNNITNQITEHINVTIGKLWENMKLSQVIIRTLWNTSAQIYTHQGSKLIAVVCYTSLSDWSEVVANTIAMQLAAMNPEYIMMDDIPAEHMHTLKEQVMNELRESGKPETMLEQIATGKLSKVFSEIVLTEQVCIIDDTKKIKDLMIWKLLLVAAIRVGL